MFMYFRKIWLSIGLLVILFLLQQLQLNLVGFAVMCIVTGCYVTHILRYKTMYKRANEKGVNDLISFNHIEKTEHFLIPFLETIIITALINLCYFVSSEFVSISMFTIGSIYLLCSHFIKNKEEFNFYSASLI